MCNLEYLFILEYYFLLLVLILFLDIFNRIYFVDDDKNSLLIIDDFVCIWCVKIRILLIVL